MRLTEPTKEWMSDATRQFWMAVNYNHCNNPTLAVNLQMKCEPISDHIERCSRFVEDIACGDCEYNDNCPVFHSRHGCCVSCQARRVMGFDTYQEWADWKETKSNEGGRKS